MKKIYWYIGIGAIALIFFMVPIMEGGITPFAYVKNLASGAYSE